MLFATYDAPMFQLGSHIRFDMYRVRYFKIL